MNQVAVLLSTYNGQDYIEELLDSVLNQTGVEAVVFIRDDGSTDGTMNILGTYRSRERVKIVEKGCNVGPGLSFMKLLIEVVRTYDFEYFAFADEDDIWKKDKLKEAVIKLEEYDESALYCSNVDIYQKLENGEFKSVGCRYKITPDLSLKGHITKNVIQGCTMVFNRKLAQAIADRGLPKKMILDYGLHDAWIFLVALVHGQVVYDERSFIFYRIHGNNEVGIGKVSKFRKIKQYLGMEKGKERKRNIRSETAGELLALYPDMDYKYKEFLREIAFYKKNLKAKVTLMKDKEIWELSGEGFLAFAVKVVCNYI